MALYMVEYSIDGHMVFHVGIEAECESDAHADAIEQLGLQECQIKAIKLA